MESDWSETWLRHKKLGQTYQAAATLENWSVCADAAEEMRTLSTDLLLWAIKKQKANVDPG